MPDTPLGFVAHQLSVVAHVLGQPLRPRPVALDQVLFLAGHRIHRSLPEKLQEESRSWPC